MDELKKKEVYYYKEQKGELVKEYRFFKHSSGWHFLITTQSPSIITSTIEFDLPKQLIPTIILDKLDEDFTS